MVKRKDTGMYLRYFIQVHCTTMRHTWGVKHEETTSIEQGSHTYFMRRWLRLHEAQPIMSSYPVPMSMLFPRGIDHNKYQLRFFPEPFKCLCRSYSIESKYHILYNCRRYNKYWNLNRELLKNFITFLEFNPEVFFFHKKIT